jgi:hypothetical protein
MSSPLEILNTLPKEEAEEIINDRFSYKFWEEAEDEYQRQKQAIIRFESIMPESFEAEPQQKGKSLLDSEMKSILLNHFYEKLGQPKRINVINSNKELLIPMYVLFQEEIETKDLKVKVYARQSKIWIEKQ